MAPDDLEHKTIEQLKDMLDDALDRAKNAADQDEQNGLIGRAIDIWKELRRRGA